MEPTTTATSPLIQFPYLTLNETAKALGVAKQTLYLWIKSGQIKPPRYIGEKPYFSIADLESSLKEKSIYNK